MKEGWAKYKLNELGKLNRGKSKHRPRNDISLFGGEYPFIQTGDIKAANFYISEYSQTYNEKGLAQSKLWKKETLCITIAANIAETGILNIDACFPDSVIGFVADKNKSNVKFIKYHFDLLKLHLQSISQGTTQDNLSQEKLLKFDFIVPNDVKHQQRIASILSAYDDLIEVNNKRIELLEQSARELYKEWFVRMRFPNYQNTKFNKGIPEGWEAKKIGEIVDRKKFGKTYKEVELEKIGNVIVIDQSAHPFLGFHNNKADHLATEENPIILFGDHSCKMEIMIKPFSLAENVIPFKALDNDMSIYYLYHLVNNLVVTTEYKRHWGELTSKLVLIPNNKDISNLFHEFCTSIYSQINYLKEYNLQLTEIRNRLLPRLISGKLEVKA